uniref:Uncharacterized protein n=1 Tax=Tetraselmis chuii TaxID=63592 RepID=A0A7S1X6H4_9CHLO|mmetsp:Transcript_33321/g.59648  ORF Transcript_33321/g.59648 Transcript_33321/m.59648 type:complete len:457 (+) Transcript_33321:3-1373(+)
MQATTVDPPVDALPAIAPRQPAGRSAAPIVTTAAPAVENPADVSGRNDEESAGRVSISALPQHVTLAASTFQDWAFGFDSPSAAPQVVATGPRQPVGDSLSPRPSTSEPVSVDIGRVGGSGGNGALAAAAAAAHLGFSVDAYNEWLFNDGSARDGYVRRNVSQSPFYQSTEATRGPSTESTQLSDHGCVRGGICDDGDYLAGVADAVEANKQAERNVNNAGDESAEEARTCVRALRSQQVDSPEVEDLRVEAAKDGIQIEVTELPATIPGSDAVHTTSSRFFRNSLPEPVVDTSPLEYSDGPSGPRLPTEEAKQEGTANWARARRTPARPAPELTATEWSPPIAAGPSLSAPSTNGTVYYTLEGEATITRTQAASGSDGVAARNSRIGSQVEFTAPPHSHQYWAPPTQPTTADSRRNVQPVDASAVESGSSGSRAVGRKYVDAEVERIARIMGRRG